MNKHEDHESEIHVDLYLFMFQDICIRGFVRNPGIQGIYPLYTRISRIPRSRIMAELRALFALFRGFEEKVQKCTEEVRRIPG